MSRLKALLEFRLSGFQHKALGWPTSSYKGVASNGCAWTHYMTLLTQGTSTTTGSHCVGGVFTRIAICLVRMMHIPFTRIETSPIEMEKHLERA